MNPSNEPSVSETPTTENSPTTPEQGAFVPPILHEPVSAAAPQPTSNNKRKKLILVGSILGAVVLLGGSAAAYVSWYQNPENVVAHSIANIVTEFPVSAEGALDMGNDDVAVRIETKTKGNEKAGSLDATAKIKFKSGEFKNQELSVSAAAVVITDGDMYFKVSNIEKALDKFITVAFEKQLESYKKLGYNFTQKDIDQYKEQVMSQYVTVIRKFDGQWIKVSADDLKNKKDKDSSCMADLFKKIGKDKDITKSFTDTYKDNRFIVIKESLGVKDGSSGYLLTIDEAKLKAYSKSIESTEFGKAAIKCDEDTFKNDKKSTDKEDPLKNSRVELWVDQWSHKVTRVVIKGDMGDSKTDGTLSLDMGFGYDKNIGEIKAPENAKSLSEIKSDIEAATSGLLGSFVSET